MSVDLFMPTLIFYYQERCPICKEMVRLVDEIDVRTSIWVTKVDVSNRTSPEWEWWYRFCRDTVGSKIVPVTVFWQRGFERGVPHTIILEKRYSGVLTKGVRERVAYVSTRLMNELKPYMLSERIGFYGG